LLPLLFIDHIAISSAISLHQVLNRHILLMRQDGLNDGGQLIDALFLGIKLRLLVDNQLISLAEVLFEKHIFFFKL